MFIPGRYSSAPLPGQAPSEVLRAAGIQRFRAVGAACASRLVICDGLPVSTPCAGGTVPGFAINVLLLFEEWAVPAQAGEAVCLPHHVGLCRGLGAYGLPALAPPKPANPHTPDRLPSHTSLRSVSYGTARLTAAAPGHPTNPCVCETGQHHRLTGGLTPQPQCVIDRPTTPERQQKGINIYPRKQRLPPLRVWMSRIFLGKPSM